MLNRAALLAAAAVLLTAGCGHAPGTVAAANGARDWSGVEAMADHAPTRSPYRTQAEAAGKAAKYYCNPNVEARNPQAYVLTPESAAFRQAEATRGDQQRLALAKAIANDRPVMAAFQGWAQASADDKLATFERIAAIEAQAFAITAPPISTKAGVPKDGTMAYFLGSRDGVGKVVLYPKAIAQGDKWAAIATVTHEVRHAYQFQLARRGAKHLLPAGSADEALAFGFAQADKAIDQAGGEDNLSYGDYCHLNNEFDAFATGNMAAKLVSGGLADTSGLGFHDLQFDASGRALASVFDLEAKVGPERLLDAVNQAEREAQRAD